MSRKFASITGNLLMRKGEAGPSSGMQLRDPLPQHAIRQQEQRPQEGRYERAPQPAPAQVVASSRPSPIVAKPEAPKVTSSKSAPSSSASAAARHRIALRLNDDQFRRLGIAAARTHLTAQEFLTNALDAYVAALSETELAGCRCLDVGGSCGGDGAQSQCGRPKDNGAGE